MPCEKSELVDYLKEIHNMSLREACKVFNLRSSVYRQVFKSSDDEICVELILLADSNHTWGFRMMHNRLKNLGFGWNDKRTYRIYKSGRLNLRSKRKKFLPARLKQPLVRPHLSERDLEYRFYALQFGKW